MEDNHDYYRHHRELTRGDKPALLRRRAELDANLANHHPIVEPLTQSKWLAQLKRLDDPHTVELALQYIQKYIISKLTQPQIPSFLACFSQSTDHDTRRKCSRVGCLRVFEAMCITVRKDILTKHAGRVASAVCLYASDPDESVRTSCSTVVQRLVQHTSASLDSVVAPFLSLLRSSHRWQAQVGACQCLAEAVQVAKNKVDKDSIDMKVLDATSRKLLNTTRSLLKKMQPLAKAAVYRVLLICARSLSLLSSLSSLSSLSTTLSAAEREKSDQLGHRPQQQNFACGPLIRTVCDDITMSDASTSGPSWQSRRSAALTLGEILYLVVILI